MSTPADEIEVDLGEIDDKKAKEAAKTDKVAVEDAAKERAPAKVDVSAEDGLKKLQKQLEEEQEARSKAEADRDIERERARRAEQAEIQAKTEVQSSQLDQIKSAISNLETTRKALRTKYASAAAAADWDQAAEAQDEMATVATQLTLLQEGRKRLESAPKPAPRPEMDPVEEYVGKIPEQFPRSRAWLRAHPEFVRDPVKNRQMLAAHELALARGETADSDGYFASVEDTLRIKKPDPVPRGNGRDKHDDGELGTDQDALSDASSATKGRSAPPASAPPSRSGTANGSRPTVVRLTAEQREIAQMNGMTDEEYARELVALRNEGKLN